MQGFTGVTYNTIISTKIAVVHGRKRNIAITLQLITARSVTSIFTPNCEQLILDLACACRLWCGHRWCFSWPWNNHLEDHDLEENIPWPRNSIHALFEMDGIEYQELFQQLLTAVLNSKEIQVLHYEISHYPTVLFDSILSCLSLIYPRWLDTCKYSCFRWEIMSHMGISHALDRYDIKNFLVIVQNWKGLCAKYLQRKYGHTSTVFDAYLMSPSK